MSGNHHKPDRNEPEDELESLLKRLQPTPLDVGQLEGLNREYARVSDVQENPPTRVQWKRVIPLVGACGLIMCAVALYQFGFKFTRGIPEPGNPPTVASPAALAPLAPDPSSHEAPVPAPPVFHDTLSHRFVPVSSQGQLIKTSSGGEVETNEGPQEKLHLQYEDSYHWHDADTGTNIRFFSPRSEELIVPLPKN